jgi:hypothetical protein
MHTLGVVIIGKNAEKYLEIISLNIIKLQNVIDAKVIFVNSGSSKEASLIANKLNYIEILIPNHNCNTASEARQKGFDFCYFNLSIKNILFIDCDMIILDDLMLFISDQFSKMLYVKPTLITYKRLDLKFNEYLDENLIGKKKGYLSIYNYINRIWGSFILLNINKPLNFFVNIPDEEEQVFLAYLYYHNWDVIGINEVFIYHIGVLESKNHFNRLIFSKRGYGFWIGLLESYKQNFSKNYLLLYIYEIVSLILLFFFFFYSNILFSLLFIFILIYNKIVLFRIFSIFKLLFFLFINFLRREKK